MGKHIKYSDALKKQVVKEYLNGAGLCGLVRKYGLSDHSRILEWRNKYLKYGCFPDNRGRSKGSGRPRKINIAQMSKDEYIAYLEMENNILKQLRSLSDSLQK